MMVARACSGNLPFPFFATTLSVPLLVSFSPFLELHCYSVVHNKAAPFFYHHAILCCSNWIAVILILALILASKTLLCQKVVICIFVIFTGFLQNSCSCLVLASDFLFSVSPVLVTSTCYDAGLSQGSIWFFITWGFFHRCIRSITSWRFNIFYFQLKENSSVSRSNCIFATS
jgi:hypothetical protein